MREGFDGRRQGVVAAGAEALVDPGVVPAARQGVLQGHFAAPGRLLGGHGQMRTRSHPPVDRIHLADQEVDVPARGACPRAPGEMADHHGRGAIEAEFVHGDPHGRFPVGARERLVRMRRDHDMADRVGRAVVVGVVEHVR